MPRKSPTKEQIEAQIYEKHGDVVKIDWYTYINTQKKCRFIDKDYGEWWATPNKVKDEGCGHKKRSNEKAKKTYLKKYGVHHSCIHPDVIAKKDRTTIKRYGVKNVQQVPEISLKSSITAKKITKIKHWKSGEELACQGSYEVAVVNHLNENKIDFLWQPKSFKMPDGYTYRPDAYLIDQDLWIEIKGRKYEASMVKWQWFHETYPNSELWDKDRLKEMKIL
jgi:hypothetical protein